MCNLSVERSIMSHFAALKDPRSPTQRRHPLSEMLVMSIAATLSGADGWVGVATFAKAKETWPRTFRTLPHGIPSHDCFGRVFALIVPEQFAACFGQWNASVAALIPDEIVAVDGKCLRRSQERGKGLAALHLVSAWATTNRVVFGQVATEAKSKQIIAQGGDYVLSLKGNQETLAAEVEEAFIDVQPW